MQGSLWSDGVIMPEFPKLDGDLSVDVLIVGGGIVGVLCAAKLQSEGVNYALVEQNRICRGVTENTTAKITSQHGLIFEKLISRFGPERTKLYLTANEDAIKEYRRLSQNIDCDFTDTCSYVYCLNDPDRISKELSALHRLGFPAVFSQTNELPFPTKGAVMFPRQAQFHPMKFLAVISKGLRIYENTKVRELIGTTAVTASGKIRAKKLILATHFPILNKHGGYFLKLYQDRSYVLALSDAQKIDGMYVDADKKGLSFRSQGDMLLLGGGSHRTGKKGGGWQELKRFASEHYPKATEVYRWATQDCMSLDLLPYVGIYSKNTPDLFVASGFNKWGMTGSMVAASILLDLVQEKENPYAEVFSPTRTILRPQLALNALESTVNLLTPTKPRCPHLGCALKWNKEEHSWDCPCHGSRFAHDGTLILGPATADLPET
ncbi:MAG: FAD-dependent oxidoreductase [Clostridia bacterium]|nr:FAD-dependent oxidoreductase [Clostridia bacterium]